MRYSVFVCSIIVAHRNLFYLCILPCPQQIFALENSLYLSGLNLYDQHRDMRLDIDDMSYEVVLLSSSS